MFKVNNKGARATPLFFFSVSIVKFEQVNAGWAEDWNRWNGDINITVNIETVFFLISQKKFKLKSAHVARANMQFHINFAHPIRKKKQKSWLHGNSDVYHYCKKHRPVTSEWPRWWIALQNFQEIDFRFLFFVEDGEK